MEYKGDFSVAMPVVRQLTVCSIVRVGYSSIIYVIANEINILRQKLLNKLVLCFVYMINRLKHFKLQMRLDIPSANPVFFVDINF